MFGLSSLATYKYFMPAQIVLGMVWSLVVLIAWKHQRGSKGSNSANGALSSVPTSHNKVDPSIFETSI